MKSEIPKTKPKTLSANNTILPDQNFTGIRVIRGSTFFGIWNLRFYFNM